MQAAGDTPALPKYHFLIGESNDISGTVINMDGNLVVEGVVVERELAIAA
jgi:hypothetical protein